MGSRGRLDSLRTWLTGVSGVAAVEFALVLPLLMVLSFGFLEIGRLFWIYHIANASVRDAARYGARLSLSCQNGVSTMPNPQAVATLARTGTIDGSAPDLVPGWSSGPPVLVRVGCVGNANLRGAYAGVTQIPVVTVTARVPFTPLFGGLIPGMQIEGLNVSHQEAWTG